MLKGSATSGNPADTGAHLRTVLRMHGVSASVRGGTSAISSSAAARSGRCDRSDSAGTAIIKEYPQILAHECLAAVTDLASHIGYYKHIVVLYMQEILQIINI